MKTKDRGHATETTAYDCCRKTAETDENGRLTTGNAATSYAYDLAGNRLAVTDAMASGRTSTPPARTPRGSRRTAAALRAGQWPPRAPR
ncbi:MAG: hypothetical protein GW911_13680 [Armatimonadetes bacterium]|nr:hypothetical protein [Armatimonadota bacterium]NCO90108.1 hypothetical protein [Armatimonadota bacterium]NCP33595.1 hypothetical protein [Armatimonadota bacterium]NCQ28907.1 hypothetical protein [Armatimonadota bacterium]NDK13075.1 hypothetical protein [Armatimonadota bacterium]